ncbi:MAG TPA: MobA/MobL family protein [Alphaproteobacteria bacterium]|nr:MobA/MobL family protein [Alphaproteobacteria bacterium]
MAIYSLNLGFISRSEGRSAVGFSAYISASRQQDIRTGVSYDYGCKEDVIVSRVLAPEGAPEWAQNSSTLWNTVEQFEDHIAVLRFRGDPRDPDHNQKSLSAKEHFLNSTQTAQTIMGAIPIEFTQLEAASCIEEFLKERFVSRGLVVEYAIHWDKGNPHFHGLMTRRPLVEGSFAQRKDRDIVTKAELIVTRKQWEVVANKHLALGGHEVRIDSRSYVDQGLDLLPTHHEGWYAQRLAERGEYSRIVADNDDIRQRNIEILCKNPGTLIQEVTLKRTVFTRQHLEEEIIRRVGGDEKLFTLLKAKVEGLEIPAELILKQANDNRDVVIEGSFESEIRKLAGQFTDRLLSNEAISYRVGENLNRDVVFTSTVYRKQEEQIIGFGDALHHHQSKSVSDDLIKKAIQNREDELGFSLSEEQRFAITHLCSGSDLRILNGKAGTGKTTLLKAVAEAYQEAGYRVLGTSFQGKAVEIMEQEIGIHCKTLDSFKYTWEKHQHHKDLIESGKLWGRPYNYALKTVNDLEPYRLTSKDVVIIDEANMVGNHLWEVFLKEATSKGAKVLIVQDPAQIKSREPGDTGRLFAERFGFAETTEVVRQRIPWQRECSKLLNDHHVLDGLKPYYDNGHVRWFEQTDLVIQKLTQDYVKDLTDNPNTTRIALAYRNSEVYAINQSIRGSLSEQGHLQDSFKIHGEEYAIGDRIRFTQNDHYGCFVQNSSESSAVGVKNGTFGTIGSYDETRSLLTVCLEGGRSVRFNVHDYKHITHGYAMSIHKSEGSTFDRSFVTLDPMMDPSTLLVAMTRHRQDVQVYVNREQSIDFKEVVDRIGRPSLSQTAQDYDVSEDQKPYFNRVQQYRDLIMEATTLREEMEGDYKHPSYSAYQTCFEEKKRVAEEILKDWQHHAPYIRLTGIRMGELEVEAGLRPRLLSDLEHRASIQVQGYMETVRETRTLWKSISQTHPGALAKPHALYEDYLSRKVERDSIASVMQETPRLYSPFFKVTKDDTGEYTDYWGEKLEKETRVYFTSVKSHAAAHNRFQLQNLFYERLNQDQKVHYDEVKAYVHARNEVAAIYSHLQKQKTDSVQVTSSGITLGTFHEAQAKRDGLALRVVESPEKYQTFFTLLNVKEDKLLTHAVGGELREKVQAYAFEQNISKRASQAQELKRILTTSSDYRIFKESGLDVNRMTFDIAFQDKVKSGEITNTLHPDEVYKPIQSYLNASKEAARLWKTVQLKGQENSEVKKDWETALQARNENALLLMNNQVSVSVLGGMGHRLYQQAEKGQTQSYHSADQVLEPHVAIRPQ